jgi:DnaJ family protein C protein 7
VITPPFLFLSPISYQDTDQHDAAVRDCEKVVQLHRTHENQATLKDAKRLEKLSKRKDYYKILGIERSASQEQIKQAYRKGALRHHPDRHVSAEPEMREKEENLFKDVSEAYSVLSDPKKKNRYDSGQDLDEFEMPGEYWIVIRRPMHVSRCVLGSDSMFMG